MERIEIMNIGNDKMMPSAPASFDQLVSGCEHREKEYRRRVNPAPWQTHFNKRFNQLFSQSSANGEMQITSYKLASMVALSQNISPYDPTQFARIYEIIEPFLIQPYSCIVKKVGDKYEFTNHTSLGKRVPKVEPKIDQVVTPEAVHYNNFTASVRNRLKMYLTDSLKSKKPDEFTKALEACVDQFSI